MPPTDEYSTIKIACTGQIKIKGSRFIGHAIPVRTVVEAEEQIEQIAKKFYDASHNCYAYRIGFEENLVNRHSDAGEPAGTAGLPIYQALASRQISDLVVVITRYFGGTKLGKGGLIRAYREATLVTLENTDLIKKIVFINYRICYPYSETGDVMHQIESANAKIQKSDYGDQVTLVVAIRRSRAAPFKAKLIELAHLGVKILELQISIVSFI